PLTELAGPRHGVKAGQFLLELDAEDRSTAGVSGRLWWHGWRTGAHGEHFTREPPLRAILQAVYSRSVHTSAELEPESRHRVCWYGRRTPDVPPELAFQTVEDRELLYCAHPMLFPNNNSRSSTV